MNGAMSTGKKQLTFVYKDSPQPLKFADSRLQTHAFQPSLHSFCQAAGFVQKQWRAYLVMVRWVAELPKGDKTHSNRAPEAKFPQKADPQVLKNLWEEFKELFPDSLLGLPPDKGVQVSIPS